jgi:hypothetical protein
MISVLIFLNKYLISNSIYYLHNLKIMDLNPFYQNNNNNNKNNILNSK